MMGNRRDETLKEIIDIEQQMFTSLNTGEYERSESTQTVPPTSAG